MQLVDWHDNHLDIRLATGNCGGLLLAHQLRDRDFGDPDLPNFHVRIYRNFVRILKTNATTDDQYFIAIGVNMIASIKKMGSLQIFDNVVIANVTSACPVSGCVGVTFGVGGAPSSVSGIAEGVTQRTDGIDKIVFFSNDVKMYVNARPAFAYSATFVGTITIPSDILELVTERKILLDTIIVKMVGNITVWNNTATMYTVDVGAFFALPLAGAMELGSLHVHRNRALMFPYFSEAQRAHINRFDAAADLQAPRLGQAASSFVVMGCPSTPMAFEDQRVPGPDKRVEALFTCKDVPRLRVEQSIIVESNSVEGTPSGFANFIKMQLRAKLVRFSNITALSLRSSARSAVMVARGTQVPLSAVMFFQDTYVGAVASTLNQNNQVKTSLIETLVVDGDSRFKLASVCGLIEGSAKKNQVASYTTSQARGLQRIQIDYTPVAFLLRAPHYKILNFTVVNISVSHSCVVPPQGSSSSSSSPWTVATSTSSNQNQDTNFHVATTLFNTLPPTQKEDDASIKNANVFRVNFSKSTFTSSPPYVGDALVYVKRRDDGANNNDIVVDAVAHCVQWNGKFILSRRDPVVKGSVLPPSSFFDNVIPCRGLVPTFSSTFSDVATGRTEHDTRSRSAATPSITRTVHEVFVPVVKKIASSVRSLASAGAVLAASPLALTHGMRVMSVSIVRQCANESIHDNPLQFDSNPLFLRLGSDRVLETFRGAAYVGNWLFCVVVAFVIFIVMVVVTVVRRRRREKEDEDEEDRGERLLVQEQRHTTDDNNSNEQTSSTTTKPTRYQYFGLVEENVAMLVRWPGVLAPVIMVAGVPACSAIITVLTSSKRRDFDFVACIPGIGAFVLFPIVVAVMNYRRCDQHRHDDDGDGGDDLRNNKSNMDGRRKRRTRNNRNDDDQEEKEEVEMIVAVVDDDESSSANKKKKNQNKKKDTRKNNKKNKTARGRRGCLSQTILSLWNYLVSPWAEWKETTYFKRMGLVYEPYNRSWFAFLDYIVAVFTGSAGGLSLTCTNGACCTGSAVYALVVAVFHLAVYAYVRPFMNRVDVTLGWVMTLASLVMCAAVVAELQGASIAAFLDGLTEFAVSLSFVGIVFCVVPMFEPFVDVAWRYLRKRGLVRGDDSDENSDDEDVDDNNNNNKRSDKHKKSASNNTSNKNSTRTRRQQQQHGGLYNDDDDDDQQEEMLSSRGFLRRNPSSPQQMKSQHQNKQAVRLSEMLLSPLATTTSSTLSQPRRQEVSSDYYHRRRHDRESYDFSEESPRHQHRDKKTDRHYQEHRSRSGDGGGGGGVGADIFSPSSSSSSRLYNSSPPRQHHQERSASYSSSPFSPTASRSQSTRRHQNQTSSRSGSAAASSSPHQARQAVDAIRKRNVQRFEIL